MSCLYVPCENSPRMRSMIGWNWPPNFRYFSYAKVIIVKSLPFGIIIAFVVIPLRVLPRFAQGANQRPSPFVTWSSIFTTVCWTPCYSTISPSLFLPPAAVGLNAVEQPFSLLTMKGQLVQSQLKNIQKRHAQMCMPFFVAPCFLYNALCNYLYATISQLFALFRWVFSI